MAKEGILNLLIAYDDRGDASRIVSLFDGASYQVDAEIVDSAEELTSLLQSRHWDLAIGHLQATTLPAKKLMASIRSQGLDVPAILISNNNDTVSVVEGIRMGATYIVPEDEDQYFLLATANTLQQLEQRRVQLDWKERYRSAEMRCEELMGSSKNAIALVQDGTYIYANEPFSQLMGYHDPDDIIMAPVIDTIDSSFQARVKPFLKPLDPDKEMGKSTLSLSFVAASGQKTEVETSICQIEYQGDAALQFLVKNSTPRNVLANISEAIASDHADIEVDSSAIELELSEIELELPEIVVDKINLELHEIDEADTSQVNPKLPGLESAATKINAFEKERNTVPIQTETSPSSDNISVQKNKPLTIDPQVTLNNIQRAISSAQSSRGKDSIILCIQSEQDAQIRRDTNEENAHQVLEALTNFVVEQTSNPIVYSQDIQGVINFVINDLTLQEGKQFAVSLCQQVSEHTFQVGAQNMLLSISASIGLITKNTASAQICIEHCLKTLADANTGLSDIAGGEKVYVMDALTQTDFSVESEEKITLFGQQLLEKRLIGIAFQPIVGLNDETTEFYEVLMRPKIEEYPENIPADFISKVFDSPIAAEIDRWVILETIKKLSAKHKTAPNTCLFINLCAATINDEKFCPWLKLALRTAKIPPPNITFQLCENDAGRYIAQAKALTGGLKTIGCKVAMTHFGLSSNPLLVLDKLAVDFVKLDKQLIEGIKAGGEEQEQTQQLISLLKEKTQHCIAPFVESPTLIPTLWQCGVEYIQGHYIQAPVAEMNYDFNEED
jgi:EAL domain-containing protein (putative c-di-GMP-specific phosphodiesterase class I)/DNA-binding NarL/FixJ family response regulator